MCDENEKFTIEDSLNRMQIDQLHNATLNFSKNSLETKKLCVTAEIASVTLLLGNQENNEIRDIYMVLCVSSIVIAILFYIVDIFLYYYQDKLRDAMLKEENYIRLRHGIQLRTSVRQSAGNNRRIFSENRIIRSVFNSSQVMYWILIMISSIILLILNSTLQK